MSARPRTVLSGLVIAACLGSAGATAQDTEELYAGACERGDAIACNVFGLMLETGQGAARDLERAVELYHRACEAGALVGCTNAGRLRVRSAANPGDTARALGLFRVACEGGQALSCELLRGMQALAPGEPTERHDKLGRIGDAMTGEPLSNVLVEIVGRSEQSISDETGHVRFPDLPAGAYRVRAERLGYRAIEGVIEVPGEERFFVLMTKADAPDPREPGRIVGRVSEGGSRWLSNVEVVVLNQARARTISNSQGRYALREVEPGLVDLRFSRLGYAPRSATLVVQPGRTVEVAVTLSAEPIELEPIQVTVRSSFLEQSGFYARASRGVGTHFTLQDIRELEARDLSEVLRGRVPGLRIQYGAYDFAADTTLPGDQQLGPSGMARQARAVSARSNCPLTVYVDGRREMLEVDLDFWPPEELEAIEVYTGIDAPVEYATNLCGVILLWTRRGA